MQFTFNYSDSIIFNKSLRLIDKWYWYKWCLVTLAAVLIALIVFLQMGDSGVYVSFSYVIAIPSFIILKYLFRNWSAPQKDTLLIKLLTNKSKKMKCTDADLNLIKHCTKVINNWYLYKLCLFSAIFYLLYFFFHQLDTFRYGPFLIFIAGELPFFVDNAIPVFDDASLPFFINGRTIIFIAAGTVVPLTGILLGYLLNNWKAPKKDALLIRLKLTR